MLSALIGEAVAWLLFVMVRVNAPELPIPSGLATTLASLNTAIAMAITFPLIASLGLFAIYFISKKVIVLYQAAKFVQVGVLNTFIDLGVLNFLILFSGIAEGLAFTIFASISFTAAVINSYYWNKYWTFKEKESAQAKEFAQFLFVSIIGLFINVGVASVIVNVVGAPEGVAPGVWANVGKLIGIAFSLIWNFIGYKFWVFK